MGTQIGSYYKCNKCGKTVEDEILLFTRLNPIRFDYLIKECPQCGNKYITNNLEFFNVTNEDCNKLLISSLITWIFWIDILIMICLSPFLKYSNNSIFLIFILIDIIFGVFYFFNFKKRWEKAIKSSIKRFDNEEYIFNLLLFKIFDWETIEYYYKKNIISQKTYDDVLYNINNINIME